jgi:hypothetical protein
MKNIILFLATALLSTSVFAADDGTTDELRSAGVPERFSDTRPDEARPEGPSQEMQDAFNKFCDGLTSLEKDKLQENKGFTSLEAPENAPDDYWLNFYQSISSLVKKGMSVEERVKLATLWYDVKENGETFLNEYKTATEGLTDKEISITLNTVRNSAGFSSLVDKLKEAKATKEAEAKRAKKRNPFARSNSTPAIMGGAASMRESISNATPSVPSSKSPKGSKLKKDTLKSKKDTKPKRTRI